MNAKILIATKEKNIVALASDIIYVEAKDRHIHVVTTTERYLCTQKMEFWAEVLNSDIFFRTHRSYIVNMEHVKEFDHLSILLDNGDTIYLAKRNYKYFKDAFTQRLDSSLHS